MKTISKVSAILVISNILGAPYDEIQIQKQQEELIKRTLEHYDKYTNKKDNRTGCAKVDFRLDKTPLQNNNKNIN